MNMNLSQFNQQQNTFRVVQALIPNSGVYNPMVSRHYGMNSNLEHLESMRRTTNNFTTFNQEAIASSGVDGESMIGIRPENTGIIEISDQWHNQRQTLMIIFENVNTKTLYLASGFTDATFMDYNQNKNMYSAIRFDSIVSLTPVYNHDGTIQRYHISESDNIMATNYVNGGVNTNSRNIRTNIQRPKDVVSKVSGQAMFCDWYSEEPIRTTMAEDVNMSTEFSQHRNGINNDYLLRSVTAYSQGLLNNPEEGGATDRQRAQILGAGYSECIQETNFGGHALIATILMGASSQRTATITWGELTDLMPELNNPSICKVLGDIDSGANGIGSGIMEWGGRWEAPIATEIATAVMSMMMKYGIILAGFTMSNQRGNGYSFDMNDVGSGCAFDWNQDANGMAMFRVCHEGIPQDETEAAFRTYLSTIVFPRIGGTNTIVARVTATAYKDMCIDISINNGEWLTFIAPTFAIGLWTPINTATEYGADTLAKSMMHLFNYMGEASNIGGGATTINYPENTQPPANYGYTEEPSTYDAPTNNNNTGNSFGSFGNY